MTRTMIIAEAGVNHNGDMEIAKKLIDVAADAGADYVKFQTFKAEKLATKNLEKAAYQKVTTEAEENQWQMLKRLELKPEDHKPLIEYCLKKNIGFMSTPFDCESAIFLNDLGMDTFKIPSGELTNLPLLKLIASFKKKIIISSGMSFLDEIQETIDYFKSQGFPLEKLTVLHCTSQYPAPYNELNLNVIPALTSKLGVSSGYSDHSQGILGSIVAASLGAKVIEKHFTLSKLLPGPDHLASLEPHELKEMIRSIREVELMKGTSEKRPTQSEEDNRKLIRKSIIASETIKKGEKFSESNVTTKRPGTGISPMMWEKLLGRTAHQDYKPDELISAKELE